MGSFARKIIKELRAAGCEVVRKGKGSHTVWQSPKSATRFPVPQRLNRHTAKEILKQAGL